MKNNTMTSAVAGITLAAMAGGAAYMMSQNRSRRMRAQTRKMRKTAGKAFKNAEQILGSVTDMLQ
jgi:hypothetical protein